jgi:hypothetical protein
MKKLAVGFLSLGVLCTSGAAFADSEVGATQASASVRFVIHIPETLSISIKTTDTAAQLDAPAGDIDPLSTASAGGTPAISIRAMGNLSAGGAMALTADRSAPFENQDKERSPLVMMNWTTKGMDIAGGSRVEDFVSEKSESMNARVYLYQKDHTLESISKESPITYTISSP